MVGGEGAEAALEGHGLQGVVDLRAALGRELRGEPAARAQVRVVERDVGVEDVPGVVVVVGDDRLIVREVLLDPRADEVAEERKVRLVARVQRDHVVAEGRRLFPCVGLAVMESVARPVHRVGGVAAVGLVADDVELVVREGPHAPRLLVREDIRH